MRTAVPVPQMHRGARTALPPPKNLYIDTFAELVKKGQLAIEVPNTVPVPTYRLYILPYTMWRSQSCALRARNGRTIAGMMKLSKTHACDFLHIIATAFQSARG